MWEYSCVTLPILENWLLQLNNYILETQEHWKLKKIKTKKNGSTSKQNDKPVIIIQLPVKEKPKSKQAKSSSHTMEKKKEKRLDDNVRTEKGINIKTRLISLLTYGWVRGQGLVVEAKNCSYIVKIRVLDNQVPLRVVHPVVEIRYCDLHSPIFFIIEFDMPMNSYWTHMRCALNQRRETTLAGAIHSRRQIRWISSVPIKHSTSFPD